MLFTISSMQNLCFPNRHKDENSFILSRYAAKLSKLRKTEEAETEQPNECKTMQNGEFKL